MSLNRGRILVLVSLFTIGAIALFFVVRTQVAGPQALQKSPTSAPQAWASPDPTPNDARNYKDVIAKLEAERIALASIYQRAASPAQQADVIARARDSVTRWTGFTGLMTGFTR